VTGQLSDFSATLNEALGFWTALSNTLLSKKQPV